ncbi:MAG: aminodeoxychorismate lyase [Halioglobus sp.]|nr:aminodeoxychorismate lyase [Halioglobus sp.]
MGGDTAIWVNGTRESALDLPDRGLDYGDGLFETLLLRRGNPLFIDTHLQRLQRGLTALGFPAVLERARQELQRAAAGAGDHEWAVLRLTVTRGAGPRGYAPPERAAPRTVVRLTALEYDAGQQGEGVRLGLADIRCSAQPALAGIKHLNRLEQVLAAAQVREQGCEEGVMLDPSGTVVSAVAGNLFYLRDGALHTPALGHCGVAGTRRALLAQRWAPSIGLAVHEDSVAIEDLLAAEEVFYTNAVQGIRPVAHFGRVHWSAHPVAQRLFRCYLADCA